MGDRRSRIKLAVGAVALVLACAPGASALAPGPPTAVQDSWVDIWGTHACVPVELQANDRLGEGVTRRIGNAPLFGHLYEYDPTQVDGLGRAILPGEDHPADTALCYRTNNGFFSGSDTFTYALAGSDGALVTDVALVVVSIIETDAGAGTITGPTGLVAEPGDGQVTLTWAAGTPGVSLYNAYVDGHVVLTGAMTPTGNTATITGLTNGTQYSFSVRESTRSPGSYPSAVVVPGVLPGAPTGVTATRSAHDVAVSWDAPAEAGVPAITGYRVAVAADGVEQPAVETPDATTSTNIAGLPATARLEITVAAINPRGTGPASEPFVLAAPEPDGGHEPPTTTTTTTTTPATAAAADAVPATTTAAPPTVEPPPRTACMSRRRFSIRLIRHGRVVSSRLERSGKLVRGLAVHGGRAIIDLRGLGRGTYVATVRVRGADGKLRFDRRTYRTCVKEPAR